MKTEKMLRILALLTIFLVSTISGVSNFEASGAEPQLPSKGPLVCVWPDVIQASVGQNFTVDVKVFNLTDSQTSDPDGGVGQIPLGNLYGIDLQLTWDPTVIRCVGHTKKMPVETYPEGVLHSPTISVKNDVDETASMSGSEPETRYWLAEASMLPAAAFNGNGTFVTLTFNVVKSGQSPLRFTNLVMADIFGNPIGIGSQRGWLNPPRNGAFSTPGAPVADFTYEPSIGVVNKTMTFNASSSRSNNTIVRYLWDFNDTTVIDTTSPIVEHNYTASRNTGYQVSLRVMDNFNVTSGVVKKIVNIAITRDLNAKSISLSVDSIRPNTTLTVDQTTENLGTDNWNLYENATTIVYYNTTAFDLSDVTTATWVQMATDSAVLNKGGYKRNFFTLNSSLLPTLEANYYFMAEVTGIPAGYESNVTNNIRLSTPLLYTVNPVHKPAIQSFLAGYHQERSYKDIVIQGEETTLNVTVKNSGNVVDTVNVTFYGNGSVLGSTQILNIPVGGQLAGSWIGVLTPGYYNLTVIAQIGSVSSTSRGKVIVIKPPQLDIQYTPIKPEINQNVTFDASASKHLDPSQQLKTMTWEFFPPGVDENGKSVYLLNGNASDPNVNVIKYAFNASGTWTVMLRVVDSPAGYSYLEKRDGTGPYRMIIKVEVTGGFSLDPMIIVGAAALIVVLAVVIVLILLRRRRGPVVPTPTE